MKSTLLVERQPGMSAVHEIQLEGGTYPSPTAPMVASITRHFSSKINLSWASHRFWSVQLPSMRTKSRPRAASFERSACDTKSSIRVQYENMTLEKTLVSKRVARSNLSRWC